MNNSLLSIFVIAFPPTPVSQILSVMLIKMKKNMMIKLKKKMLKDSEMKKSKHFCGMDYLREL